MITEQLIIIGSGPAALTAAIYACRSGITPLLIEGKNPGGQLMTTSFVENWPGIRRILGPQLMINMRAHAEELGARFIARQVTQADFSGQPLKLLTDQGDTLQAHSIIIATGSESKKLGCPGEDTYWSKGVTTCAVCDGAFYKDKPVIIIGGGDTAMEDASFMTHFTNDITVIHILDKLTASTSMQQRVINNPDIKIIYNSTVSAFEGNGVHLTHAVVTNQKTQQVTRVPCDAAFIAIGLNPNTKPFEGCIDLESNGYIKVHKHTHTSVPGVFAAGDVADYIYRQAITSAGSGCMAALDAERYLKTIR